jgi:hypothetical protein
MWGLYYWGDLNIYLVLFRVSFENENQPRSTHDGGGEMPSSGNLSILSNPGWPTSKNVVRERYLSEIKFKQAHNYVLFNCNELRPFIQ